MKTFWITHIRDVTGVWNIVRKLVLGESVDHKYRQIHCMCEIPILERQLRICSQKLPKVKYLKVAVLCLAHYFTLGIVFECILKIKTLCTSWRLNRKVFDRSRLGGRRVSFDVHHELILKYKIRVDGKYFPIVFWDVFAWLQIQFVTFTRNSSLSTTGPRRMFLQECVHSLNLLELHKHRNYLTKWSTNSD